MRIEIPPAPPGTVNIKGLTAYRFVPTAEQETLTAGNGITINRGALGSLAHSIGGNTAVDSRDAYRLFFAGVWNAPDNVPWRLPLAFNFFLLDATLAAQGSIILACLGVLPNTAAPHTTWRTDATSRRVQLLMERDGGGTITWYLNSSDGAAATWVSIPAIAVGTWVTLLWSPLRRRGELYLNGVLSRAKADQVPALTNEDTRFAGHGIWKVPTGAAINRLSCYGQMIVPALSPNL